MRSPLLSLLLAAATGATIARAATYVGPTDREIQKLTMAEKPPPYRAPNPASKNEVGWAYPDPKKIRKATGTPGDCAVYISVDVSRCTGNNYRYWAYFVPYDEHSKNGIVNNVKFYSRSTNDEYVAYSYTTLPCNFNGRVMLADQKENVQRTGLLGFRVIVSKEEAVMWIQSDPDEELGIAATLVAPQSYYYFEDTDPAFKNKIFDTNIRGFDKTNLRSTKTAKNNITIVYC